MAAIGMHMEKSLLCTRNTDSTTMVKTVSAMLTEKEVMARGLPVEVLRKALSAMSANQIELTTLDRR